MEAFGHDPGNVVCSDNTFARDRDDQIAAETDGRPVEDDPALGAVQPGTRRRRVRDHLLDQRAPLRAEVVAASDRGRDVLRRDPDLGVADLAGADQLLHRPPGGVDRDREADAFGVARTRSGSAR